MSQQSAIFAAMFLGFVVFITMKGKLPAYVALLWSHASPSPAGFAPAASSPMGILQGQTTAAGTLAVPPIGMGLGSSSTSGF